MRALELKNVSFAYCGCEDRKILNGADFYLRYGEVALLCGASGEGKSTLFSIINGIIPNLSHGELCGEVLIDGENVKNKTTGERSKKVGSVLQNADSQIIQPVVEDEIAFGCENLGIASSEIKNRVEFACEKMHLDLKAKTRSLSGGQKQRLITAATLAMGQKILILDEPLANLDFEGAKELMLTLQLLAREGYAVLIIEHRLDMVLSYVDSVWSLKNGKTFKSRDKTDFLKTQTEIIKDNSKRLKSDSNLFEAKNIQKSFKRHEVLSGINLDIKKGERILLLGENGCGKTTFTKILARLLKQNGGIVRQNINQKFGDKKYGGSKWFKTVAYVYQNPNYQLFMPTVEKELLFSGYSLDYCQKIVDLFGLGDLLERHPQSLSEGQKRKVSIAAMLAAKPEVLILDEPTVGQDYDALNKLVCILNQIHDEEENTMITITHDVRCAEALCDRAFVLDGGKISKQGGKECAKEYFSQAWRTFAQNDIEN